MRLYRFDSLTSTNSVLAACARAGVATGTAFQARVQTTGRGQADRTWDSPKGGLWMSTLVRGRIPARRAGWLPLAAGAAVAQVLKDRGVDVRLKWPNDILLDDRKLGGILVESAVAGHNLEWAVIGTGLNVENDAPLETAATLRGHKAGLTADALAEPIVRALNTMAYRLETEGGPAIALAYGAFDGTMGRRVITPDATGEAVGLGAAGELIVKTERGDVEVRSGPVRFA